MSTGRIDVEALRERADLVAVVGRYVKLTRRGKEHEGLCPFHDEKSPSFTVIPSKGFVHCFGCGAHYDVFGFLQRITNCDFVEACKQLGADDFATTAVEIRKVAEAPPPGKWVAMLPVPVDAPELLQGEWTVPLFNPKSGRASRMKPIRHDAYRNRDGALLGYVLRMDLPDKRENGKLRKWTPQVTWCIGPNGRQQWCLQGFPEPRPLLGLDDLASRRAAHVVLVEGEKCRAFGAGALPSFVTMAWPGGSNGIAKVDWAPLEGRDVVLWPDADVGGIKAMVGHTDGGGRLHAGIAHYLSRVGVRSLRMIDTDGQPKGWDIADAVADGWTPAQVGAWAAQRVVAIDVVRG